MNPGTINADFDIVAVHGLGAIPDITWEENKSGVNWLSDNAMLPNLISKAGSCDLDTTHCGSERLRLERSYL